jgi:hypothetical protein
MIYNSRVLIGAEELENSQRVVFALSSIGELG